MSANYLDYFSLTEAPFSIAPNPHYLYMSDRHQEALAHLTYGFGESGGFVLLTGEVGTGKTTVSRCLLNQLPENTQAAFILNPTLSAHELLATVCDELNIAYQASASLKDLTDAIMAHLLINHQQQKNTLLVIDEAQHLQPQVLEQLRLLTNLETDSKKLLQVILIGQPELQQLLKRQDLRQLAQRITARYHLLALTEQETRNYIEHRLSVAGCSRPVFSRSALKQAHRLSGGVPRLINLLCDKALLGAYAQHQTHVDKRLLNQAARQALDIESHKLNRWQHPWFTRFAALALFAVPSALAAIYADRQVMYMDLAIVEHEQTLQKTQLDIAFATKNRVSNELIAKAQDLDKAFVSLYQSWQITYSHLSQDNTMNACDKAISLNLECYWFDGSLSQLLAMQQNAILRLVNRHGDHYYALYQPSIATPIGADAQTEQAQGDRSSDDIVLTIAGQANVLTRDFVEQQFQQQAVMLWQVPDDYLGEVDDNASPSFIAWLEQQLALVQRRAARDINAVDALLLNQFSQFKHQVADTPLSDTQAVIALTKAGQHHIVGGQ
ncbi:ExeA family protein [Thalassotalea maritima]|uniref:ExeA family protein n=1 Tax=Thalassotalea maritima TaxID=3242416 RepID=UPI003529AC77